MPREADLSEEQSRLTLDDYVVPGECDTASFPGYLKRSVVAEYVDDKLAADSASTILDRLIKLVRFFVLKGSVGAVAARIPDRCKDEGELENALLAIGACAELGGPPRKDQAVEAYDRLVGTRATDQVRTARGLCAAYFDLPRSAKPDKLREHIHRTRVRVRRDGPSVDFAEWNHCDLRLIPWLIEAKKGKDAIIHAKDPKLRIQKWSDMYLAVADKSRFDWSQHAGFYLLAEAQEQGDEAAVGALETSMAQFDEEKKGAEFVSFQKTRGYRAREYFLDELTEDEIKDRDAYTRTQDDLIL